MKRYITSIAILCGCAGTCLAQWDPAHAQYGKTDARDLRVMQWNIFDTICSTSSTKNEAMNDWCSMAHIVASLKPDVLMMEEAGDNSGNGTGSSADSVATLATAIGLFLHGGNDPFIAGNPPVTAYVQKYAPGYDLPYVYVSDQTDGYNRNVILSRYPFADLNGDGKSTYGTVIVLADQYAGGGNLSIRGYAFAEIDLPDAQFAGDVVIGCGHLKSGGTTQDYADRLAAAKNIAYLIDYWYNGAGTGIPDPHNKVIDNPPATRILGAQTPVIWGGDINEDENTNGRDGPALWMSRAASTSGDGTDRDRTDSLYDDSRDIFNAASRNTQGSSKLDYLFWQDSIATLRRSFIFYSGSMNSTTYPPELATMAVPNAASSLASDHRPVIADFILPAPVLPGAFTLLAPGNTSSGNPLAPAFSWTASSAATSYVLSLASDPALSSVIYTSNSQAGTSLQLPSGLLSSCTSYYWKVTASNAAGSASSATWSFITLSLADFNSDGSVDFFDYLDFVDAFTSGTAAADFNGDQSVDFFDYLDFVDAFTTSC